MTRPLFDPARIRGSPPTPPPRPPSTPGVPSGTSPGRPPTAPPAPTTTDPEPRVSVSQLAAIIDSAIRTGVPARVRVLGQVSNFHDRTHWYFDLKDAAAVISCVMFAPAARKAGFRPTDGIEVVAGGRVEFYSRQGRTQFYVDSLEPVGAGALELAFRALCEELRAKGYFDPARKRTIPAFPRRIAVITSAGSAAWADVRDTVARRCPAVELALIDVRVQGSEAPAQIARALRFVSRRHNELGIDAVLLTRGGGSAEDLAAFNDRAVADAVCACEVPVAAAIGHETDTTIAELVADLRCATPSQAAARLTPDRAALGQQRDALASRLAAAARRQAAHERERLRLLARRPALADPAMLARAQRRALEQTARALAGAGRAGIHAARERFGRCTARLARVRPAEIHLKRTAQMAQTGQRLRDALGARLRENGSRVAGLAFLTQQAVRHATAEHGGYVQSLSRQLELVGPAAVLRRGFSVTTTERGTIVTAPDDVQADEIVRTRVSEGVFLSRVVRAEVRASEVPVRATVSGGGADRAQLRAGAGVQSGSCGTEATPLDVADPRSDDTPASKGGPGAAQLDLFSGGE